VDEFLEYLFRLYNNEQKGLEKCKAYEHIVLVLLAFAAHEAQLYAILNMYSIAFMLMYYFVSFSHNNLLFHFMHTFKKVSGNLNGVVSNNIRYWAKSSVLNTNFGGDIGGYPVLRASTVH
jgi:hypothetical protein